MNIALIPIGDNPPDNIYVVIDVPVGGEPVKYEFDKVSGALFVDRILHTPMRYPANYGFVPHTLSPDGDPIDALVVARSSFIPGCVVRVRPIAVLFLEDEHGGRAEAFDVKAHLRKIDRGTFETVALGLVELDHLRDEQRLAGDRSAVSRRAHPLEHQSFVRSVLVDDD